MGCLFTAISNACVFAKVEIIPLASAVGLTFMVSNILFTLVGKLILKEDLDCRKAVGMSLCIIGSGLIVLGLVNSVQLIEPLDTDLQNNTALSQSNLSAQDSNLMHSSMERNILTTTTSSLILGLGICVLHGISDVIYFYCSKTLKDQVDDILVLDFWYLWGSITFTVLSMVLFEKDRIALPTRLDDTMYLAAHSLTSGVAHMLNYVLLTLISFIAIGILVNLEIPLAMLCQYVIVPHFQPIRGGVFDLSGAIVITIGLLLPSLGELWHLKCQQTQHREQDGEMDEHGNKYCDETKVQTTMETTQSKKHCLNFNDDSHIENMKTKEEVKITSF